MKSLLMHTVALLVTAGTALGDADAQVTTGELGDATEVLENPQGAAYRGVVTKNAFGIKGSLTAVTAEGKGTEFAIDVENLPTSGGPFRTSHAAISVAHANPASLPYTRNACNR